MPELMIWVSREINKMRRDMDRLFTRFCDEFRVPLFPDRIREVPPMDIRETEEDLIIRLEVPDIDPEDLDISLSDDTLTIKGKKRERIVQNGEDYRIEERRTGSFSRTIRLHYRVRVDDVRATYKDGILHIVLPKFRPEKRQGVRVKIG
nr:Hsp20/alpha crystallin family protein [Desulfobacterales bacterium]